MSASPFGLGCIVKKETRAAADIFPPSQGRREAYTNADSENASGTPQADDGPAPRQ